MTMEEQITAARAEADRQRAHVNKMIEVIVRDARGLVAKHGTTDAWALLGQKIADQLQLHGRYQQSAAEMLAEIAVRRAEQELADEYRPEEGRRP